MICVSQAGRDLIGLEGKSLKKGTVTPWKCFKDIGCDKHVHKLITKYLQKEEEILIEKRSSTLIFSFFQLLFLLNCKEDSYLQFSYFFIFCVVRCPFVLSFFLSSFGRN